MARVRVLGLVGLQWSGSGLGLGLAHLFFNANVGFGVRTLYGCFVTKVSVPLDRLDPALKETDMIKRLIRGSMLIHKGVTTMFSCAGLSSGEFG